MGVADELLEQLRNENSRLLSQINTLRGDVASIRSAKDQQLSEYQKLLMEENKKNTESLIYVGPSLSRMAHTTADKHLSEEIVRLRNRQCERLCCSSKADKTENVQLKMSEYLQVESGICNDLDVNVTRKRSRHHETAAEIPFTLCAGDQLQHAPEGESASVLSKQIVSSGYGLKIDLPECCRRNINLSGDGANATGPANCMFHDLIECLVGMKLSTVALTDGICISAVHQSSGYSFSLTWVDKAGGEEMELLYRVLSLGMLERVAPVWMREVLMFSTSMCPIFFERLSRVIRLHH
ncbi:hypothetical protein U1Q18_042459 [Sarracenia purpurea var. burkii]